VSELGDALSSGGLEDITGVAARATELDMVISPDGPNKGLLVCVIKHHGSHVCWGCMEIFGAPFTPDGPHEVMVGGGTVPVLLHRKCVDPKNRKIFSDMKGDKRRLQSVEEVTKGLRIRKSLASAAKPFVDAASRAVNKLIID
jgi:hypothetical protein